MLFLYRWVSIPCIIFVVSLIEIVILVVQHVIIIILSVLSTFLVVSGPWERRVPGKGGSLGRAGPCEGRFPGKGGSLVGAGPWEWRTASVILRVHTCCQPTSRVSREG